MNTSTDYYNLFESAYDAIFVEKTDGQIIDVNPAACELLQYTRAELLSMNVSQISPANAFDILKKQLQADLSSSGHPLIVQHIRKDGTYVHIDVRIRQVSQNGEQFLLIIARDISERVDLLAKEQQQRKCLTSIHQISLDLLNQRDVGKLLTTLLEHTCDFFGTPHSVICLVNENLAVPALEVKIGTSRYAQAAGSVYHLGEGLIGTVWQTGQPLVIKDYQGWHNRRPNLAFSQVQTSAGIPLISEKKTIGVICLDYCDRPRTFSPEEMTLFKQFADLAAIAITNASLHTALVTSKYELQQNHANLTAVHEELIATEEELRQQFEVLSMNEEEIRRQNMVLNSLHDTAISLMNRLDLDDVLKMITISATALLRTPHGFIYVKDESQDFFHRKIGLGYYARDVGRKTKLTEGLVGQVFSTGEIIIIDDYSSWEHRLQPAFFDDLHNVVQAPLKIEGKVIGTFGLALQETQRKFTSQEIALLSRFAELAAIALDNATLVTSYKQELLERQQAEKALSLSEEQNQALINAIPDPILVMNHRGILLDLRGNQKQLHFPAKDLLGKSIMQMVPAAIAGLFLKHTAIALATGSIQIFEYQLADFDKTSYYEARIAANGPDKVLAIIRNITGRKSMELQLQHLSLHDTLTGLYNRSYWETEMKRFAKVHNHAAIIIFDVDGLKIINDSLGHHMGDIMLKAVANILRNSFQPRDIIARIGGDEFAALLPHNALPLIEELCKTIRRKIDLYNIENPTVPISLSMGFATRKSPAAPMNFLFKEADNTMYREKLHRQKSARSAIVQALMKALEARDFITEGHGDRLQDLMEAFAAELGLPGQKTADLRLLSQFHDIGKVGIPDSILFKPGQLTEEEFVIMRQHCEIGYRIAKSAPDLAPIANWILRHHEWWNGKGYPFGLTGEEIPLACRMLGIVDAFDAMTHDRPYRKALDQQTALEELRNSGGTQFDPALITPFIALVKNKFS